MYSLTGSGGARYKSPRNLPPTARGSVGQSLRVYTRREVSMYKRKGKSRITVPPTVWAAIPLLETARRLNQRCFELLAMTALRHRDGGIPAFAHEERWARVDERSIERAGRCPVLLLSLQFNHLEWWERMSAGEQGPLILNAPLPVF